MTIEEKKANLKSTIEMHNTLIRLPGMARITAASAFTMAKKWLMKEIHF